MTRRIMWLCHYDGGLSDTCCHSRTHCHQVYVTVEEMAYMPKAGVVECDCGCGATKPDDGRCECGQVHS